jgi:hypothetical protein
VADAADLNPEDDLPADFELNRDVHYRALRQPLDASTFIAELKDRMRQAYARFDQALRHDTCGGVRFTTRHGEPWISVPKLDKLPEPRSGRLGTLRGVRRHLGESLPGHREVVGERLGGVHSVPALRPGNQGDHLHHQLD